MSWNLYVSVSKPISQLLTHNFDFDEWVEYKICSKCSKYITEYVKHILYNTVINLIEINKKLRKMHG